MSPYQFETYALPVLAEMSQSVGDHPILEMLHTQGLSDVEASAMVQALIDGEYVAAKTTKAWGGEIVQTADVRLLPKTLVMLDLWPTDDQRAIWLTEKLVAAIEQLSDSPDTPAEKRPVLKAGARAVRDIGVDVTAAILTRSITGEV